MPVLLRPCTSLLFFPSHKIMSSPFIVVPNEDDALSETTQMTDSAIEELATTHECVRTLLEQNKMLVKALVGMRCFLRDPSSRLIQRIARGIAGRRRAASKLAAVVKIQSAARASHLVGLRRKALKGVVSLQAHARVHKARIVVRRAREVVKSVVISAAARRFLVLTTTVVGALLSKTRRLAKAFFLESATLATAKVDAAHATEQLQSKNRALADLRDSLHSKGCALAILRQKLVTEKLKVEVFGSNIWAKDLERNYHRGTITKILNNGHYEITFDKFSKGNGEKAVLTFPVCKFRIAEHRRVPTDSSD